MKDLYDELGVPRSAAPEAIKKAYRKRARAAHPDRGGSTDEMARINRAYDVLSDPVKRLTYDRDGSLHEGRDPDTYLDSMLAKMLLDAISTVGVEVDVIAMMRNSIKDQQAKHKQNCVQFKQNIKKFERALERLKGPPGSMLSVALNSMIEEQQRSIAKADSDVEVGNALLEKLAVYSWDGVAFAAARPAFVNAQWTSLR